MVVRGRCVPSPACGGELGRGVARDGFGDDLGNTSAVGYRIQIAEPQNAQPLRLKEGIAASKTRRLVVLPAIDLDDKARCMTDEVCDIPTDRHLSAKRCAVQSMCAYNIPTMRSALVKFARSARARDR